MCSHEHGTDRQRATGGRPEPRRIRLAGRTRSTLLVAALGLALSRLAAASCVDLALPNSPGGKAPAAQSFSGLMPALYHPGAGLNARATPIDLRYTAAPSIIGMWRFRFSPELGGDFGTQLWHEDGTEIMLSAARDPAAGDVCMGAWKQTGRYTYVLNHIAMGHDGPPGGPPSPTFTNTVHLHEYIRLDPSGDSYTGRIDAVISAANPADPFDESSVIATVSGTVTGQRVEP